MRTIKYIPKQTNANTEYVEIHIDDMTWLKQELQRYLSLFAELDNSRNSDIQQILKNYWYKTDKNLPKGKDGINSPVSFIGGLVNNLNYNGQRDLSTKVLKPIEEISTMVYTLEEALEDLTKKPNTHKTCITFLIEINQYVF